VSTALDEDNVGRDSDRTDPPFDDEYRD